MPGPGFDGGAALGDAGLDPATAQTVRRITIAGFRCLWDGRTPFLAELVDAGPALDEAVAHLQARGRIEVSADGRLLAVHGLSRRTTRHRIEHETGRVHTWCAFDAVGIPAGLGVDARAVTRCRMCGRELVVTLVGGRPADPLPDPVLWYPEPADAWNHLVDEFCSRANLFCSLIHLTEWIGHDAPAGRILTIDEAVELGRDAWSDVSA